MFRTLLLATGLLATCGALAADGYQPDPDERRQQAATMRLLQGFLGNRQYALRARPLDEVVEPAFQAYLDALDPGRRYFSTADLASLADARAGFRAALEGKDLAPVTEVYAAYAARVDAHAAFVQAQLAGPGEPGAPGGASPEVQAADQAALETRWRHQLHEEWQALRAAGLTADEARRALLARHADQARHVRERSPTEVFTLFADAFTTSIDPHGAYLPPMDVAALAGDAADHVGVGLVVRRGTAFPTVQQVVPGGPAANAGVRTGEHILALADAAGTWTGTAGLRLDTVVQAMRGEAGSSLQLRLRSPAGAVRQVTVVRAALEPAQLAAAGSIETVGERRIGVIALPGFYADFEAARRGDPDARTAAADVAKLLGEFEAQGVHGVLLDLRGNGGGALRQGVDVAALFLGRQPVVQVRETGGRVNVEVGASGPRWGGPLAVLVDRDSAAAAEIVAAALQDHGRARVLGERSFGRGTVQQLVDLGRASAEPRGYLKFTVADFFRVDGRAVDGVGVQPDVALPEAGASAPEEAPAPAGLPPVQGFAPGKAPGTAGSGALETVARRLLGSAGEGG